MNSMEKVATGILTLVQLGGIAGITFIALKRNDDAYKAECKRIKAEFDLIMKEVEIYKLEREIEELKKKYEVEEEA